MGRPRKTPRRIVSFNIEQTTADRIDDLNLSNRSEWANKALKDIMDGRLEQRKAFTDSHRKADQNRATEQVMEDLINDPHRLSVMLLTALQARGLDDSKLKGRFTIGEQLLIAINQQTFREVFMSHADVMDEIRRRLGDD